MQNIAWEIEIKQDMFCGFKILQPNGNFTINLPENLTDRSPVSNKIEFIAESIALFWQTQAHTEFSIFYLLLFELLNNFVKRNWGKNQTLVRF